MAQSKSSVQGIFGIVLLLTIVSLWVTTTNSVQSLPPRPLPGSKLGSYPPPPLLSATNSPTPPPKTPPISSKRPVDRADLGDFTETLVTAAVEFNVLKYGVVGSATNSPPPPPKTPPISSKSPEDRADLGDFTETLVAAAVEFNVLKYGAVGDGATNDTEAFLDAWAAACAVDAGYVHAPAGYNFYVYPSIFNGPCKANMTFKVDGTLLAPEDPAIWDNYGKYWLKFSKVSMTLQGRGTIDGRGQTWWADSCKTVETNPCVDGPTALVFDTCTNVVVKNVLIKDSQQMHLAFEKSSAITVNNLNVSALGTSPNTDGIHLQNSSTVSIKNTVIGTGDDCISIQTGSFNVTIKNVTCGPGHGISVGGLGKSKSRAELSALTVDTVVFNGATNGVRIKSWQGSTGYANNFSFKNIKMIDTKNPILIDQYYCDSDSSGSCTNYTDSVLISDIKYKNITGTSGTKAAVTFHCSETVACTGISLYDIDLVQTSGSAATSSCVDAYGTASGTLIPASCLAS